MGLQQSLQKLLKIPEFAEELEHGEPGTVCQVLNQMYMAGKYGRTFKLTRNFITFLKVEDLLV